jgi:hypothetical protein
MPNHADRVAKNYEGLCSKCLKRPNREWEPDFTWPHLCEICSWARHYTENKVGPPKDIEQEVFKELGLL